MPSQEITRGDSYSPLIHLGFEGYAKEDYLQNYLRIFLVEYH